MSSRAGSWRRWAEASAVSVVAVAALATAGLAHTGAKEVVVRPGDTLSALAARHGVSIDALVRANGIADRNVIRAGQVLALPSSQAASQSAPPRGEQPASGAAPLPAKLQASASRMALMPRFDHWAATYGVAADLLKAVAWQESGWQNHMVSVVGAQGIGQLMPDTVAFVNQRLLRTSLDPADPDDNIRMAARFLRYLVDRTGDESQAVAAYYQGLASVSQNGRLAETEAYVASVEALRPRFR